LSRRNFNVSGGFSFLKTELSLLGPAWLRMITGATLGIPFRKACYLLSSCPSQATPKEDVVDLVLKTPVFI
jgi:hypothetical protein